MAGWGGAAASDLKAAGAEALPDGRTGVRLKGWHIESFNGPILNSAAVQKWEETLQTTHLPEMVFGESSLVLLHEPTGTKLHFNALDALKGWKEEALPPVEVPAAAQWKFRSKPSEQVILDYDYTFTTPYCGSEIREHNTQKNLLYNPENLQNIRHIVVARAFHLYDVNSSIEPEIAFFVETLEESSPGFCWEGTDEQINLAALSSQTEPILFYDEVVLYEDELADSGVSLLTVKVRVMPSCWFLLLRFWLRVDGVLMRLRDTRVYCAFDENKDKPVIIREVNWRESPISALSAKGYLVDPAAYGDPNLIKERLPIVLHKNQKLKISR